MTIQTLGEALPPLPQPLACPSTTVEIPALLLRGIARVEGTGELMFFEYTSGANCFDPLLGVLDFHGEGNWIGGTGRFVNLTGSFETTAAAMVLVSDPTRQNFSSFSGEVTGTLLLPK